MLLRMPLRSASGDETRILDARSVALVICDVWDRHWCHTATARTAVLAPRIASVADRLRNAGCLIIHAPSGAVGAYTHHAARRRVSALPVSPAPIARLAEPSPPPVPGPACPDDPPCQESLHVWSAEHSTVRVENDDAIVDDDAGEVWTVLQDAQIQLVLLAGVHANACILDRSFGIKQLRRWGVPCALVRDLTEAMPASSTPAVVDHIERHWCPSTDSSGIETLAEPKHIVARAYDVIWERYEQWEDDGGDSHRHARIEEALAFVPARHAALDLGCGTGTKATSRLAEVFDSVTGVDISPNTIDAARLRLPGARFVLADMTDLDLPEGAFDLVTAFYSIIHVPRQEQRDLFRRIASWLVPGGVLIANLGVRADEDMESNWLGAPMYWSSWDSETSKRLIREAGLHILSAREEARVEHETEAAFVWLMASKRV